MSRSAVDATRFTATSPHAYSKPTPVGSAPASSLSPNPPPSSSSKPSSPPRQETPHEKVARLRAERFAARASSLSRWERIVIRGRVWADRAHKITALSLIGFSIIAGGITAFALTDMIMHNRRKRAAFYAEQHALYTQRLVAAIETEKAGIPLTPDQALVLNRERAKIQAEERKREASWRRKVGNVFMGGMKKDTMDAAPEQQQGGMFAGGSVPSEGDILETLGVDKVRMLEAAEGKGKVAGIPAEEPQPTPVTERIAETRQEGERMLEERGSGGGMLDQLGSNVANSARDRSRWLNWGSREQ
ncbi:MAG: hypothetical protein OHK93_004085 [Ramalina farinacea]|uniref:Cytochrome oxidase c assembly-domain-containing protein n=1 Tax=Ramalina farinacea TaxID=258253 RepID=A0AA43TNW8_9LECA|nr:hypothetical protein [Ramalina farinacea]